VVDTHRQVGGVHARVVTIRVVPARLRHGEPIR
jgi:hypothetical protein